VRRHDPSSADVLQTSVPAQSRSPTVTVHLLRRGAAGAVGATLLLATPAFAHPFFDPAEVPVDSLATVTLDLAHGCDVDDHDEGDDVDGAEAPTREVAVEVPDAAVFVEPDDPDGWELSVEGGDGEPEVIVYTAEDGTDVPAPQFDLDVVLTGEPGDEVYWRVVQACDEMTYRWVGTPDEPAEDPAILVTLSEPDEDAPPPDEADEAGAVTGVEQDVAEEPTEEPADEAPVTDELDFEAADDEGGGMPGWILIVVLVATLVVAGVVLSLKGRDEGDDATSDGTTSDTDSSGGGGTGAP
jgi:uncharacterized protein YcnI